MADTGASKLFVVLGTGVMLAMTCVWIAARCIHRKKELSLLRDLEAKDPEFHARLKNLKTPSLLASAELMAISYSVRKNHFSDTYDLVMHHTGWGRSLLRGMDKVRQSISGALTLSLGVALGLWIQYEAQQLGVPSQGYFGGVLTLLIAVLVFDLATSGLEHYTNSQLSRGGVYGYDDSLMQQLLQGRSQSAQGL